jgi:hypothetical protein
MKAALLAFLFCLTAHAQILGVGNRHIYTSGGGATSNIGTLGKDSTQNNNANYYQTNYVETGSNANGYTVNSCSLWVGSGTFGNKIDCVVIVPGSATTYTSSVLCHGTYTEPSVAPNAFVSIPMTGCGTLPANTFYWVGFNTGDNTALNGFYSCDSGTASCTGAAGSATYQAWYIASPYGTYTNIPTTALNAAGNVQVSAYLTVTPN